MQKNKGFTLVELLVAVAILSVVLVSITSMMVTGSKSFAKGNADAEMQREAQLVVDQIEDMVIDTNGGVDFVATAQQKELVLYNKIPDGAGSYNYTKEVVTWNKAEETIRYSKYDVAYNNDTKTYEPTGTPICENDLLAEGVRDFDVDVSDTVDEYNADGEQITIVQSVQIMAEYTGNEGKVVYATTPVITLRNRMMLASNPRMIFEEPEYVEPKQLAVDVEVLGYKIDAGSHDVFIQCRGTVNAIGFEEGELKYEWSCDYPSSIPKGNTNPNECEVVIKYLDYWTNPGALVTVTLTATPTISTEIGPVSDSDTMTLPTTGEADTYHERGQTKGESHYYIDNANNGDVESFSIKVMDRTGTSYPDEKKLIELIVVGKDDKGGFSFNVNEGLDPTREYFIEVTAHCKNNMGVMTDVVKTLYIPAVVIKPAECYCVWSGFEDNENQFKYYGDSFLGDGIQYYVDGYLNETWVTSHPYKVELIAYDATYQGKSLQEQGLELVLQGLGQVNTIASGGGNRIHQSFSLNVPALTYENRKKVVVSRVTFKITMVQDGFEAISGEVTVYFS